MADAAATVIQCPQCSKKFKLPAKPPAVFTCTGCGTAMDLSSFRGAAAPAAPAPSAPSAAAEPEARSSSSRSGRADRGARSARGGGKPARLTARVRRGREGAEEDGDGDDRSSAPPKDKSSTFIVVSLIGFVVVVGLIFVVLKNKSGKEDAAKIAAAKEKADKETAERAAAARAEAAMETAMTEEAPMAEHKPEVKKGGFHKVDHHPDSTPDEQATIDKLVQTAVFENAGSDSREAGRQLVALGLKAAPRLVNVFNTVKEGEGYDDMQGKVKAGVADQLLRKIDGYQEKKRHMMQVIKPTSEMKFAEGIAKSWIQWWDNEVWKKEPLKPYDPRVDGGDDAVGAMVPAMKEAPMEGEGGMADDGEK